MKRPGTRNSSDGLAIIMVLVMVIIFASLILAVVISSTTAIRRAHYYQDKTTALEIAEAGIQDTLYWMNYVGYENQYYPCTDPSTGLYDGTIQYFQGSDHTGTDTWTSTEPASYNPGKVAGGRCVVKFSDEDETDTANLDTITSTGYYKGRAATVKVRLRGQNGRGNPLMPVATPWVRVMRDIGWVNGNWTNGVATWGIPEDFNKHTVFGHYVRAGSPATVTLTGNIAYYEPVGSDFPTSGTKWTKTQIRYEVNEESITRVDSSIYIPVAPPPQAIPSDKIYSDTSPLPYPFNMDPDGPGPAPEATVYAADCFDFTSGDTITVPVRILGDARFQGDMGVRSYVQVLAQDAAPGNVTVQGTARISGFVDAAGSVTLTQNAIVTHGTDVCVKGNGISVSSNSVQIDTGLFYSTGNITVNVNNAAGNEFVGVFFSENGSVDLSNSCKIGTADYPARIVATGATSSVFMRGMTLHGSVYSQGQIWIGNNNNTIIADRNTGVALVMDRAAVGGSATISTQTTNDTITGLIHARGGGSSTIILNNDTVTGTVVADGTVLYNGTVTHNFDTQNYTQNPFIYPNFMGGRRKYVPVPGSWEVMW